MKVLLLAVGKPRDSLAGPLHDRYAERIGKLGCAYRARNVPETAAGGRYSDAHVQEREAADLRKLWERRGQRIALDPRGETISSEGLAERLERWANPQLTLLLGGPLGLDPQLVKECDGAWSLSRMTFPHELARVLVAEQLYRALTIRAGIPYHK